MKKTFLCVSILLVLVVGCSNSEKKTPKIDYVINYSAFGWKLDVTINGIPVLKDDKDWGFVPVGNFTRNGINEIVVTARQVDDKPEDLYVDVAACDLLDTSRVLSLPVEYKIPPIGKGKTVTKTFEFTAVHSVQWSWETAPEVADLSEADKKEMYLQLQKLAEAMTVKDVEAYYQVRRVAIQDTAKFCELTENQFREKLQKTSPPLFHNHGPFTLKKIDQLQFIPCGRVVCVSALGAFQEDRVIKAELKNQSPSVEGSVGFNQVFFSKIDGKWKIVH